MTDFPVTAQRRIVVIGQGYVGLPVSIRAGEVGFTSIGLDLDQRKIDALQAGQSYVEDIAAERIRALLDNGRFIPTSDYAQARGFDVAIISVPTPLKDGLPDLSYIEQSCTSLAPYVRPGCTVILESTTYPGTTEEIVVPLLEQGSGLHAGSDFHVGYSPERIDPGNTRYGFEETPKIVSGIDQESTKQVTAIYEHLVDEVVVVSGPKEAELAKLIENTFRHVNIAMVNELAMLSHDLEINVWEAISAAASKPFGFMAFYPGPGVGGHCLPIDPEYLSWQTKRKLGREFRFVELANDVNDYMPRYTVNRLQDLLNEQMKPLKGSRIVLLGLAYKAGTGDTRESPALRIAQILQDSGAEVVAIDPYVADIHWPVGVGRESIDDHSLNDADAAVLVTNHAEFNQELLADGPSIVLDTRNVVQGPSITRL